VQEIRNMNSMGPARAPVQAELQRHWKGIIIRIWEANWEQVHARQIMQQFTAVELDEWTQDGIS